MDKYIEGCGSGCSSPYNFAVGDPKTMNVFFDYASKFSLADRYFHPAAGASSMNDMYFARASYVFNDDEIVPGGSVGGYCDYISNPIGVNGYYYDPIVTGLLSSCGFLLKTYAEGFEYAKANITGNPCYPKGYTSSDIPYEYYVGIKDKDKYIGGMTNFENDVNNKVLPEVSFIKPLGYKTAHPFDGTITDEANFIKEVVDRINNSTYQNDTLIVWVPDESGGFYDHIPIPPTSDVDDISYGPRLPFLAIGRFAKKNYVSHVEMEHSSIVKFIEWNWLNGETGHLNVRDKNVNSIGDLIDPNEAGIVVPN